MIEQIKELLVMVAPLLAGFLTSIVIPIVIKNFSLKKLQIKIDEVNQGKQLKDINEKLDRIENDLLTMRGKKK